jgi:Holliday junction resolvase
VNKKKAKGTAAETAVVKYLKENGFVNVERRTLQGQYDKGDISGIDGLVIEVKDHKTMTLGQWVEELKVEIENADAQTGAVIHKRRGKGDVGEWYATMPVWIYLELLRELGYE